MFKKITAI